MSESTAALPTILCSTFTQHADKYEVSNRALKNELNVLLPLDELRFVKEGENACPNNSQGGGSGPGGERLFRDCCSVMLCRAVLFCVVLFYAVLSATAMNSLTVCSSAM